MWPFTFQQQQQQQHQQSNQQNEIKLHESHSPKRSQESPGAWYTREAAMNNHYNVNIYSTVSNVSNSSFDLECDYKNGIINNNNNNDNNNDSNSVRSEHR